MRRAALWVLAVVGSGCATFGSLGAPKLPYAARVYLLDSEEDLMTAVARADEAAREVEHAKASVDEVKSRFGTLRDSPLKQELRAELAVENARLGRAQASRALLSNAQACAEGRYAAAKAQAEWRFKLDGASESKPARLADQAEACEAALKPYKEALAAGEEHVARALVDRDRAQAQAAAVSPTMNPRPFIE